MSAVGSPPDKHDTVQEHQSASTPAHVLVQFHGRNCETGVICC